MTLFCPDRSKLHSEHNHFKSCLLVVLQTESMNLDIFQVSIMMQLFWHHFDLFITITSQQRHLFWDHTAVVQYSEYLFI